MVERETSRARSSQQISVDLSEKPEERGLPGLIAKNPTRRGGDSLCGISFSNLCGNNPRRRAKVPVPSMEGQARRDDCSNRKMVI